MEERQDLISRQAAIDTLYHVDEYNGRSIEAIRNLPSEQPEPCEDAVSRQAVINIINKPVIIKAKEQIEALPSVLPERKQMTNKEWIDFLSVQFDISRTSAREMLHGMMQCKREDNFKKQFNRRWEQE